MNTFKQLSVLCLTALLTTAVQAQPKPSAENFLPYLSGPLDQTSMIAPHESAHPASNTYILPATPATSQWGVFNSALKPVLTINPGDSVAIETSAASDNQVVPGTTAKQIIQMGNAVPGRGPHTLTGPIYVNGAEPGDVIRIHINKIRPRAYASNNNVPGKGLFPNDFPNGFVKYYYLDIKNKIMQFAPGIIVPLAPFPGVIAVARATPGSFNSDPPGPFGGNMDLRELTEGSTLYLPVFMKGGLIWTGDSHAGQGNGEIDLTAIETAFAELNLTIDLIKKKPLTWPRVETPTAWIAVGYDKDLNKALDILKSETIKLIMEQRRVSKEDAKKIMLATWNCPIAEVVNGVQGVYCMLPKSTTEKAPTLSKVDTSAFFVTHAKSNDLHQAMSVASRNMLNKIISIKKLSHLDAYILASFTMDCRIAPHESGDKEVYCMMAKNLWKE